MTYEIKAVDLWKLYGQAFSVYNQKTKHDERLEIAQKDVFLARDGLEAYGLRLMHHHSQLGDIHAFLKIFKADLPQRRERSEFLISLGLAGQHEWVFQGVPYGWFGRKQINGVEVIGHATKFIGLQYGAPAEEFFILKDSGDWDGYAADERRAFACHLASAVDALERMQFTHGDLSHRNIMIGPGPGGRRVCCLCDFDGFAHPKVPLLPRQHNGQPVRPLGAEGYQYPELLARIAADARNSDDRVYVETDRFALGVLACEMVAWTNDLPQRLKREQLLSDEMISKRSLRSLPDDVKQRFTAGFNLLERALQAGSCADMPSPRDWLEALGLPSIVQNVSFQGEPFLQVFDRKKHRRLVSRARLNTKNSGDFGALQTDLRIVSYRRTDDNKVNIAIAGPLPAALRRAGRTQSISADGRKDLAVQPGDVIIIGDWELLFEDSTAASGRAS
jgi:serine/threonine protein kinase